MKRGPWVGVDGCRGGWFAVSIEASGRVGCARFEGIAELAAAFPAGARIGIDIPIGLPSRHCPFRDCDHAARRLLGPGLTSRVFSPPARRTLAAENHAGACAINRAETGKAISLQSYHIMEKIREVDAWLRQHPAVGDRVREFHPELVFLRLNDGTPVRSSKKLRDGFDQRMALIRAHSPAVARACDEAIDAYPRKLVARDDILDAAAIAVALTNGDLQTAVPRPAPRDNADLPMQIHY